MTGGKIVVPGAQTLAGHGTVAGAAQVDGTVAPGSSVGSLTVDGDVTINGTYSAELDFQNDFSLTTTADCIVVTDSTGITPHSVTLGGSSTLQFTFLNAPGSGTITSRTLTIVQNDTSGALNGGSFSVELPAQLAGLMAYQVNYAVDAANSPTEEGTGNDITVTFSAVPEPAALGTLSLAPLLWRRRGRLRVHQNA